MAKKKKESEESEESAEQTVEETTETAGRKGVFIGAYVDPALKVSIKRRAKGNMRTLSQEVIVILTEAVHGTGVLAGGIERRSPDSTPRRRDDDPHPRRRAEDKKE